MFTKPPTAGNKPNVVSGRNVKSTSNLDNGLKPALSAKIPSFKTP